MYNKEKVIMLDDGIALVEKIKAKRKAAEELRFVEKKKCGNRRLKRIFNTVSFMCQAVLLAAGLWSFGILWLLLQGVTLTPPN